MSKQERVKMVKAMEYIARHMNDENIFESWLILGIADGDIRYGDLDADTEEDLDYYLEDGPFAELMDLFLRLMKRANKSGGLCCDNVVSKSEEGSNDNT